MRARVQNVFWVRSSNRPAEQYPKSQAAKSASSAMPMLVGLVREPMAPAGCSWKLSGGSQFSSDVTNTSKNLQVRRDSFPRKTRCLPDSWTVRVVSGRLDGKVVGVAGNYLIFTDD